MDKDVFENQKVNTQCFNCSDCLSPGRKEIPDPCGLSQDHFESLTGNTRQEFNSDDASKITIDAENKVGGFSTVIYHVDGMCCSEESSMVEKALSKIEGVRDVSIRLVSREVSVTFDPLKVGEARIVKAVESLGLKVVIDKKASEKPESIWRKYKDALPAVVSGILLIVGLGLQWLAGIGQHAVVWIYLLAIAVGGARFAGKGLISASNLSLDMNALMSVAVIGAIIIGEWVEGAVVVFLFSVAHLLETYSIDRTRKSISFLMQLSPGRTIVRRKGKEYTVPVDEVKIGELIIIRPGERISLDGIVSGGGSIVDQSSITGESIPVEKSAGDEVFAGSINIDGALEVTTTRHSSDTTLARIVHMVEEAQSQKAPSQVFVDRFARIYTPVVMVTAGLVAFVPPLVLGQNFVDWFYRALVLLVISCPCALVISTPVTVVSGLAAAARRGVLIKGGVYLENLGKVKAVALDKTGTLTMGKPRVVDVIPLNQKSERELLSIAAAIESRSEHPLAAAIVEKAREQQLPSMEVLDFCSIPGKGAMAKVNGHEYALGSHRFFDELDFCTPQLEQLVTPMEKQGRMVVVVGCEHEIIGIITLADVIRKESKRAIEKLREAGVATVMMLTGDNEATAGAVGEKVGVDDVKAGLLPEEKMEAVKELCARYPVTAMVGDGVNDAPALASATISVAMGAAGTDQAIETADVALMGDNLMLLSWVIRMGRRALGIIKTNITVSIGIKLAFLLLAVSGFATMWMAIAADMGTSLLVIFNGMRLLGEYPDQ